MGGCNRQAQDESISSFFCFFLSFFYFDQFLFLFLRSLPGDLSFGILFIISFSSFFSLDRCSIPSREVSILWSYLDITLLFSSYVYLIFWHYLDKTPFLY